MTRLRLCLSFLALGLLLAPVPVLAANPQHLAPTALTLTAATATAVPMVQGICYYEIQNKDSASIWYGLDATVTATNGIEIEAATHKYVSITYQAAQAGTVIWLYSTAGTSAGAVRVTGAC